MGNLSFLECLIGKRHTATGWEMLPLGEHASEINETRRLLGLTDCAENIILARAITLQELVLSDPGCSFMLDIDYRKLSIDSRMLPAAVSTVPLVSNAEGPARAVTGNAEGIPWPFSGVCTFQFLTDKNATLQCDSYIEHVACTRSGNKLYVEWPDWTGLSGAVDLTKFPIGEEGILPIRFRYPVKQIARLLSESSLFYDLIERNNIDELFFVADRPEEAVALGALALYKEVVV